MMDVVIFGLGPQSSLARYMLTDDSPYRVIGFTVDEAYRTVDCFDGLPVAPFERVEEYFFPDKCRMFAPLGWKRMNRFRAERVAQGQSKGYSFASYISSRSLIWPDLQAGDNGIILDGAIVESSARIGANCNLRSDCIISHRAVIDDHCFIGAKAVVSSSAVIGKRCVLGLNSVVCDGIKVAPGCFIGAGAVVTADTQENGVYVGAPARRRLQPADQLREVSDLIVS